MSSPRRRAVVAFAIGALLGAMILTAAAGWLFFGNTQTMLLSGLNGCIPPCPHSTATYHDDLVTGRRWIAISTVDEHGIPIGSSEMDEPPFGGTLQDLIPLALIGATCGGVVALGVSRTGRATRSAA